MKRHGLASLVNIYMDEKLTSTINSITKVCERKFAFGWQIVNKILRDSTSHGVRLSENT